MTDQPDIYISKGRTGSGDEVEVFLWKYRPTNEEVEALYQQVYAYEYEEDGEGVYFTIEHAMWAHK
jgi:hypothetical protein